MLFRHVACCVLLAFCLTFPAPLSAEPRAGETWQEPATGMIFVWVPGGVVKPAFGPIARDPYYGDDDPRSVPRISGFWLGKFEVTQRQWRKIMQGNPAAFQKGDAYPVESVSLPEVFEFITKMNAAGGATFRLPSTMEWSYAARSGGRPEKYAGGNTANRLAWHKGNSGGSTHPVGTKAPNGLGLYDMSGNVWEWCGVGPDSRAFAGQGQGNTAPSDLDIQTFCGGGWKDDPMEVHAISPKLALPDNRQDDLGFRLVRIP